MNRSTTYLLPLIAESIGIEPKFYHLIENTYMFDSNNEYENCFFIVQNFSFKNPEYTAYEHRLTNNNLFLKLIDVNDKVIYIFKFPKEYIYEYTEFSKSKYSTFMDDAKKQIILFWTIIKGKQSTGANFVLKVKQILYKEKIFKNQIENKLGVKLDDTAELGSFVDINEETINIENFKKNVAIATKH